MISLSLPPTQRKKFKVVALDLDGTTLTSHNIVSDRTKQTLQRLNEKGLRVIVATGRQSVAACQEIKLMMLSQKTGYVVCVNGAMGFAVDRDDPIPKCIFSRKVPLELLPDLINFLNEKELLINIYVSSTGIIHSVPPSTKTQIELLDRYISFGEARIEMQSYEEIINQEEVSKITVLTNNPTELIEEASQRFGKSFHIILGSPDPYFIEFLPQNVCKGEALLQMCQFMNVDVSDVVAFGDGDNDKEFLQYAGYGIAMKNAKEPTKAIADLVLEWTNDEDGVAQQLELMERQDCFEYSDLLME